MSDILIGGVPFLALSHRDGRFVRLAGPFAFARQVPGGVYQLLHLEMTEAIARDAGPGHDHWGWALGVGMNALLVHGFGQAAVLAQNALLDWETVTWHPGAQVNFLDQDGARQADLSPLVSDVRSLNLNRAPSSRTF